MALVKLNRVVAIRGGGQNNAGEVVSVDDETATYLVNAGWAEPVSRTAAAPAGKTGGTGGEKAPTGPPVDKMQQSISTKRPRPG